MAGELLGQKSNGRIVWKIDTVIAVSGKNSGWADADENGTSTDLNVAVHWDNTKAFFAIKFGNTDELFILCSDTV